MLRSDARMDDTRNMILIAIIEDDRSIALSLADTLQSMGFNTLTAINGRAGLALVRDHAPDLVILDILLPEMNGWDVCKAIRQVSTVPILIVSALNETMDRIQGLEIGADDYLTKPFSTGELIAHIKAMLRRIEFGGGKAARSGLQQYGSLTIDLERRKLYKNEQPVELRYKAFELLSLLVSNIGKPVSRSEIFTKVWGTDWIGDTRTLDVHVRWLREKIEDDPAHPIHIQTVRTIGYCFMPE